MAETLFGNPAYEASTLQGNVVWLVQKLPRREYTLIGEAARQFIADMNEARECWADDGRKRDRALHELCTFYVGEAEKQQASK